jgi:hypothetical protein
VSVASSDSAKHFDQVPTRPSHGTEPEEWPATEDPRAESFLQRAGEPDALIREARRRTRRRRARGAMAVMTVLGSVTAIVLLTDSGAKRPTGAPARGPATVLPAGRVVSLASAGPLAVAPDGALYVADIARHRVLVRLRDGRFRVIAGTGRDGFSGDGGLAIRAALSTITDIASSATGDLYIADGGRIRVVGHDGIIRTVAGDGQPLPMAHRQPVATIHSGTPALDAALGSPQSVSAETPMIAFSPAGRLYISTAVQLVRLTSRGTLTAIRAVVTSGPSVLRGLLRGAGPLAIDHHGNIDIAGFNGWSIWQISPSGVAHEVGAGSGARESGGDLSLLQRAPSGRVYGENGPELLELDGRQLKPTHDFGNSFWLTYFAFGPRGGVYADELPGNGGFEARQRLLAIGRGHATLLWEQPDKAKH